MSVLHPDELEHLAQLRQEDARIEAANTAREAALQEEDSDEVRMHKTLRAQIRAMVRAHPLVFEVMGELLRPGMASGVLMQPDAPLSPTEMLMYRAGQDSIYRWFRMNADAPPEEDMA